MDSWINATGIAAVFTALFALRYRRWHSPRVLLLFFGGFFAWSSLPITGFYLLAALARRWGSSALA